LDTIIWKSTSRKEAHYDKGKILDRTLEQSAHAGTGICHSDLCWRRLVHFGIVRHGGLYRACDYRGALLSGCRTAFSHAVRMAWGKIR
jgi:hypothetical protein